MRSPNVAAPLLVAATLLSISNPRSAKSAQNEDNNTFRTAHSTYTISAKPDQEHQCLYRNGKKLFCGGNWYLYFGEPVKTANYTLIPLSSKCGGNGCPLSDVWLVIERGSKTTVKHIAGDCFLCELTVLHTNPRIDAASFNIGKKKGYRLTASFGKGNLSVHRTKISSKINKADCEAVYLCFNGCASENYSCISTQSEARLWKEFEARHPSFFEKKILPMCERVHAGALSKDVAFHKFCRITPAATR